MKQFKPYCIAFLFRSKHFVFPIFQSVPTKTKMMWCGILKTFYALKIKIYYDKFGKKTCSILLCTKKPHHWFESINKESPFFLW